MKTLHCCHKCGVVKVMEPYDETLSIWERSDRDCHILYPAEDARFDHKECNGIYEPLTLSINL